MGLEKPSTAPTCKPYNKGIQMNYSQDDLNQLCALIFMGAQEHKIDPELLYRAALDKIHYFNGSPNDNFKTIAFKAAIEFGKNEEIRYR